MNILREHWPHLAHNSYKSLFHIPRSIFYVQLQLFGRFTSRSNRFFYYSLFTCINLSTQRFYVIRFWGHNTNKQQKQTHTFTIASLALCFTIRHSNNEHMNIMMMMILTSKTSSVDSSGESLAICSCRANFTSSILFFFVTGTATPTTLG